jgi:hypothetical protein
MNKLKYGGGNLIGQVEKLKDLGATTNKSMPANLLGDGETEVSPEIQTAQA